MLDHLNQMVLKRAFEESCLEISDAPANAPLWPRVMSRVAMDMRLKKSIKQADRGVTNQTSDCEEKIIMKEVVAILRPGKVRETREALARIGVYASSMMRVLGRGKQRGLRYRNTAEASLRASKTVSMQYLPKKMLILVISDQQLKPVVDTIAQVNRTGQYGDGKIFVLDVEEAYRIRTGERSLEAVRNL